MPVELDVIYLPTKYEVAREALKISSLNKGETIYDIGCGSGRVLKLAAKEFFAYALGCDKDPLRIKEVKAMIKRNHLEHMINVFRSDFLIDIPELNKADVVYTYLYEHINEKIAPRLEKLKKNTRIITINYKIPTMSHKHIKSEFFSTDWIHLYKI